MHSATATITATHPVPRALSAKSPLRYPGGKTRAVDAITQHFPKGLDLMVSPFFGGGSVELFLASRGTRVLGFDLFLPLVDFWQCLLTEPAQLAAVVARSYPLSRAAFYQLQRESMQCTDKLQRAAAYYVLNRASFSGSTLSGGMSPNHPRYTLSSIDRIRCFHNPNISVERAHFSVPLQQYSDVFAYLDPPYLIRNNLYGKNGDAHRNFDHPGLAALLRGRGRWILSYNDCPEIRSLYSGYRIEMPEWKYGMANDKTSREVLIFSHDLS